MTAVWPSPRLPLSKFLACLLFIFGLCGGNSLTNAAPRSAHANGFATQEFFCYTSFHRDECLERIVKLRGELLRYSAALPSHWTWVIVASEDWPMLVRKLHLDGHSPAFTALKARQSFLEGALFSPTPPRADELARTFGVPAGQLLSIAVRHELGHAICDEVSEVIAKRVAEQLRSGERVDCTHSLNRADELFFRNQTAGFPRH
jgi:hypothetical protein